MFKTVVRLVTLPVLCVTLGVLSTAPNAPGPYFQIEQLEQSRVLGNGQLAELLRSSDETLAIRAALAIGRTKRPAGIALLAAHLHDRRAALRAMSVYGIGLIGGRSAAAPAIVALADPSAMVRVAALDAASRLERAGGFTAGPESVAAARAAVLLRDPDPIVRARAATALQNFHGTRQDAAALRALVFAYPHERSAFVRWHIVWTLFRGYARETPARILRRALNDRDEVTRIEAARAFGRRGDARAIDALQRRVRNDPSWRVQEQALESIRVLRGQAPTEHLSAIPAGVRTPAPQIDRFARVLPLARRPSSPNLLAPQPGQITTHPLLNPQSVGAFTGPALGRHPFVRIATTQGNVYVELYPEWAPLTVENFLNLANRGYYDGNPWFRVVPDFVVQTGDPRGNGSGDAGYTIPAEENPIEQDSYVISMGLNYTDPPNAHAIRDSAGTQFYITLSPQLHLDSDFTVFGRVISGFDVLGRLIEKDKIVRVERLADR